ncbi:amino acid adenylation domain-containing protein [Paenibacillus sp. FSL H7-0756]|uniref:amino acid adenylation domain-containing protein n=1 Tax=unclassified Paenibacillus TaxID=185978 RepID=UPI0030F5A2E5
MSDFLLQHYLICSAERCPERTALYHEGRELTYGGLYRRSLQISDALISAGMLPGETAAICLDKSPQAICAMFGVLFTAGAYIPLDTTYSPVQRMLAILESSGTQYLITERTNLKKLLKEADSGQAEHLRSLHVLLLDEKKAESEDDNEDGAYDCKAVHVETGQPLRDLQSGRRPPISEDLAYILYTSGSTGVPKGVMITHLNARTFIDWCCSYFKPEEQDRFSAVAPFHFDLAVFDIFVPVAVGATLILLGTEVIQHPSRFLAAVRQERISWIYTVPSLWNAVVKYARFPEGGLPSLRGVLFAGEVLQPKLLLRMMELLPRADFYNLYGLIETNVCTCYPLTAQQIIRDAPVPIGYPCGNTGVVVITADGRLASSGEEGEICVRGSIVMKGYYRNPQLTEQSFRRVPPEWGLGDRLYCTGDMATVDEDGALVLIGRRDAMIKRSGFRVELPEIERVLHELEMILHAIVVDIPDSEGYPLICAAVIVQDAGSFTVLGLKQAVGKRLPGYMVPDLVHVYDCFPAGGSGKVDRQQLKLEFSRRL